jgi:hypothetical protein
MIPQNYNRSKNVAMEHNVPQLCPVGQFETQIYQLKKK